MLVRKISAWGIFINLPLYNSLKLRDFSFPCFVIVVAFSSCSYTVLLLFQEVPKLKREGEKRKKQLANAIFLKSENLAIKRAKRFRLITEWFSLLFYKINRRF